MVMSHVGLMHEEAKASGWHSLHQAALEEQAKCSNTAAEAFVQKAVLFGEEVANHSTDMASRCGKTAEVVAHSDIRMIAEEAEGLVLEENHTDVAVAVGYMVAEESHIETAGVSAEKSVAEEKGSLYSIDCSESMHKGRPLARSSLEQQVQGMQKGCKSRDMGPLLLLHSFGGCTAVIDPGSVATTEHSSGDCTSAATDTGYRTTTRRSSLAARSQHCSGILLATAEQDHRTAAGRMWAVRDIAAVEAEAAVAVPADSHILHSHFVNTGCMDLGSDCPEAAGSARLGSKTLCRK